MRVMDNLVGRCSNVFKWVKHLMNSSIYVGINLSILYINLQPNEYNTYADIEAVYECLERDYSAKQEDIVLYGQSVGSGPTLEIATRLPNLRAVVLHSPILSGVRVMYPVKRTYWFDIYKVWLEGASKDD